MSTEAKILIVDDEERFRKTMSKLLAIRGLETMNVGSGREALAEMQNASFEVAVVDVRMPGMSGVELLSEMKRLDPRIEVIILTGHASVDTAKAILRLGAYDYLLKPYSIDELEEKILSAQDRRKSIIKLTGGTAQQGQSG